MDPFMRDQLRRSFAAGAARWRVSSPVLSALCAELAAGPSQAAADIMLRYVRITSDLEPDPVRLLAALHSLALKGRAPRAAAFFPSCGGTFRPDLAARATAAAEADMSGEAEEILDFMLSRDPAHEEIQACALLLPGAFAAAERLGGGLSLLQIGAGSGVHLLLDHISCRIGEASVQGRTQPAPLALELQAHGNAAGLGRLLAGGLPPVDRRIGLGASPLDLSDPNEWNAVAAYIAPDDLERLGRLRAATELLNKAGRPPVRRGAPEEDLPGLLRQMYQDLVPGNTLLLLDALHWHRLADEQRKRITLAVQGLAARLKPGKPLAWLQLAPFPPDYSVVELRLHTFGWSHPEDRAVRRLAEADSELKWLRWLE